MHHGWSKAIIPYFNLILVEGWKLFLARESSDLLMGANNSTSAYAKVGLYPFNPLANSWENAMDMLGLDKALDMERVARKQFEIKVITSEESRPTLSQEEEDAILTSWKFKIKRMRFQLQKHPRMSSS